MGIGIYGHKGLVDCTTLQAGPEVIKLFPCSAQLSIQFQMPISIKKFSFFSGSDKLIMLFFLLINGKMPTTVGILTIISRKNVMLNSVEHEQSFITSWPGLGLCCWQIC